MKYPRHISKPEEILVKELKNSLARSWGVGYSDVTIHHITIYSQSYMVVVTEVKTKSGEIFFDMHEEY